MGDAKTPPAAARAEARRNPGGWVYEIGQGVDLAGRIPPAAIVGYWKVDASGEIVGDFVPNPGHDSDRYPPPRRGGESETAAAREPRRRT